MNLNKVLYLMLAVLLCVGVAVAQEKMNKEQWQQEMNKYTGMVNDLKAKVKTLSDKISAMQSQTTKLDADYEKCMDELYALVGSDRDKAAAYRAEIEAAENTANELMRLSDADLMARSSEVNDLSAKVKSLWENKLSLVPEFWDRLTALNEKVKSLQSTIAGAGKTYTVGTWKRDRDCLWNISKKKDIYNNAWMWPKIWQGNRDQIKDPDIIHPGQKLKIPTAGEMTKEEKAAARSYYAKKAAK
ncbi:MAG: LysM peptidoglycan-binding domain-containing protein [Bacteroidota bacterium]